MAASLVKYDDDKKSATSAIWRNVRQMLDAEFPDAAMVAEWSAPKQALRAGYDMDFCLNNDDTRYYTLMRDYQGGADNSFFKKDAPARDMGRFLEVYMDWYTDTRDLGYISLLTCNHDTVRPRFNLEPDELKLAYAFLFTMPGVPFLYYGDEIGMRYQQLPTKEGGYFRTGSRTPMQWDNGKNLGFSEGCADSLYLPVDPSADAPTVAAQEGQPHSLLETVRALLSLRHQEEDLQADAAFEPVYVQPGQAFAYRRGSLLLAVNPAGGEAALPVDVQGKQPIFTIGSASAEGGGLTLGGQSFVVLK